MRVGDIMTRTVHTVGLDADLRQVARLICRHHISGVPVVDDAGRLRGIVSERDILRALYPGYDELVDDPVRSRNFEDMESRYPAATRRKVREVMVCDVITATPDSPVLESAATMLLRRIRRLPVVQGERLVGIVSLGDVHQAIFLQHFGPG